LATRPAAHQGPRLGGTLPLPAGGVRPGELPAEQPPGQALSPVRAGLGDPG